MAATEKRSVSASEILFAHIGNVWGHRAVGAKHLGFDGPGYALVVKEHECDVVLGCLRRWR